MRVCFVLSSLEPSGGVAVAAAHARGLLHDHGVDAELVVLEGGGGAPGGLEELPVRTLDEAAGRPYDVAVSTWWQTAPALWELDARRRVSLLQSFEQRFYGPDAPFERLSAEATLALPVDFVAVAAWQRDLLAELRPGARCRVVTPGVDKAVFSAERAPRAGGPLEVLVEGQPSLPFKGVPEAVAAARAMREPARVTLVALDPAAAGELPVDRVVGGLAPAGMAELYAASDVLVKLSRVEGIGLAPIEGFHSGLPCVVTPYTGHDEYARHGENAVVVGFDDLPGTAAWLDLLARDRELLASLSAKARETAAAWPSTTESSALLHEALLEVASSDPPVAADALLLRGLALNTELGRARFNRRSAATEERLTEAEALVRELSASRDECGRMLEDTRAELERVRNTPVYRLARRAKRLLRRR